MPPTLQGERRLMSDTRGSAAFAAAQTAAPIDHAHLGRYTMGNRALEVEVLQLFAGQAPETLAMLAAAVTDRDWHIAAHTLKGSARAVGAWEIATLAETAERDGPAEPSRSENLARIGASLEHVRQYIDTLTVPA
jgi:HPt (histidine-containing phosphotransfer) domain-containing protein